MGKKKKIGRPPKNKKDKYENPQRWIGRWSAESWAPVVEAAEVEGLSVPDFARKYLGEAASRVLAKR